MLYFKQKNIIQFQVWGGPSFAVMRQFEAILGEFLRELIKNVSSSTSHKKTVKLLDFSFFSL